MSPCRPLSFLKSAAKAVRVSQPFNLLATSSVKAVLRATGLKSEGIIKHVHRSGAVRSRLPNGTTMTLWSRADDWICNQVYWRGWQEYEPGLCPLFYRLAVAARTTFDVGAHVGFYTLLAAHANPAGRVFAFEPLPPVFERLQRNVRLNRLDHVELINAAVGETEGTADFFHSGGIPSSSSLSEEFMRNAADVRCSKVPVLTLDGFVRSRGVERVDLVKLDTETTEPLILRGMRKTLERDRPVLICEVLEGYGCEQALDSILRPLGYRFALVGPDGPTAVDSITAGGNYLFVHPDADGPVRP